MLRINKADAVRPLALVESAELQRNGGVASGADDQHQVGRPTAVAGSILLTYILHFTLSTSILRTTAILLTSRHKIMVTARQWISCLAVFNSR